MKTEVTFDAASCVCDQQEEIEMGLPSVLVSLWNESAY